MPSRSRPSALGGRADWQVSSQRGTNSSVAGARSAWYVFERNHYFLFVYVVMAELCQQVSRRSIVTRYNLGMLALQNGN